MISPLISFLSSALFNNNEISKLSKNPSWFYLADDYVVLTNVGDAPIVASIVEAYNSEEVLEAISDD